jgi:acetyl-CoA acyltransferase 1
MESTRRL